MKKILTILAFTFSIAATAQTAFDLDTSFKPRPISVITSRPKPGPCDAYVAGTYDKVTGKTTVGFKTELQLGLDVKSSFRVLGLLNEERKEIILHINAAPAKVLCVDKGDKINILFRDGTRLEMENMGEYNCGGEFNIYFIIGIGRDAEFKNCIAQLSRKEIETVRVWARGQSADRDLTPAQSKKLLAAMQCLNNNSGLY